MEPQSADVSGGKPKGLRVETPSPNRPMGRVELPRGSGGKLPLDRLFDFKPLPGYYKLSPTDMAKLKEHCSELTIPVNPGDVVFFAGGALVHSSPAVPAGAATRYMTYAHWQEVTSADGSGHAR